MTQEMTVTTHMMTSDETFVTMASAVLMRLLNEPKLAEYVRDGLLHPAEAERIVDGTQAWQLRGEQWSQTGDYLTSEMVQ